MTKKTLKFNSFTGLLNAIDPQSNNDNWLKFLQEKGHTQTTFNYLPEQLKTSLQFSFARRQNTN